MRRGGAAVLSRSATMLRTGTGSTACARTCTSGARIGTTRHTTAVLRSATLPDPAVGFVAYPAAAPGGIMSKSRAAPRAPAFRRRSSTPIMGFASRAISRKGKSKTRAAQQNQHAYHRGQPRKPVAKAHIESLGFQKLHVCLENPGREKRQRFKHFSLGVDNCGYPCVGNAD